LAGNKNLNGLIQRETDMEIQIFDWREKHFRGGPCCEPPLKTSFQGWLMGWAAPKNWFLGADHLPAPGKLDF